MATPSIAANAYANLAKMTTPGGGLTKTVSDATAGPSFTDMLKSAVGSVVDTGRKSDAQAAGLVNGKANLVDVATAVSETEVAVQTLVSVRDKVIQAYEEIMRMQI